MRAKLVEFLLNNIEAVFLLPAIAIGECALLWAAGLLRRSFRTVASVAACFSLTAAYGIAFSPSAYHSFTWFLLTIVYAAPQVVLFVAMAIIAIVKKIKDESYRGLSVWPLLAVAIIGHAWTRLFIAALTSATSRGTE